MCALRPHTLGTPLPAVLTTRTHTHPRTRAHKRTHPNAGVDLCAAGRPLSRLSLFCLSRFAGALLACISSGSSSPSSRFTSRSPAQLGVSLNATRRKHQVRKLLRRARWRKLGLVLMVCTRRMSREAAAAAGAAFGAECRQSAARGRLGTQGGRRCRCTPLFVTHAQPSPPTHTRVPHKLRKLTPLLTFLPSPSPSSLSPLPFLVSNGIQPPLHPCPPQPDQHPQ